MKDNVLMSLLDIMALTYKCNKHSIFEMLCLLLNLSDVKVTSVAKILPLKIKVNSGT